MNVTCELSLAAPNVPSKNESILVDDDLEFTSWHASSAYDASAGWYLGLSQLNRHPVFSWIHCSDQWSRPLAILARID